MMQTVTEPGGTATQAAILGYHVAGKTGTARKAFNGGYSREYRAFFAGLVPVDNPRFSMVVVLDNPQASIYGGIVVGAGVPQRHGRRLAPDGRAAGRHRDLDRGAGKSRSQTTSGETVVAGGECRFHGACRVARAVAGRRAMKRAMALADLLPDLDVPRDIVVRGLVLDSRAVEPGDAFVAIAGFGAHGLGFVEQAKAAGAAAILFEPPAPAEFQVPADAIAVPGLRARMGEMADRFHARPSRDMSMVGVTGTNGKTSTVQLLAQAWHLRGIRAGSIGTLGAGLYGEVVATGFTTPLVLQMHALLAELRDAGAKAVAMEVSSHALDQGRVANVHFDVAVFTNLTRDHLDYHGDMDTYGAAKARLFAWPELKAAVINLDDAFGRELSGQLAQEVRSIGLSSRGEEKAAVRAENLNLDASGIAFDLLVEGQAHGVQSKLLGRFNVDNLLAVAGALHALGRCAGRYRAHAFAGCSRSTGA